MELVLEERVGGEIVRAVAQVAEQLTAGFGSEVDGAGLVAFAMPDLDGAGAEVNIGDVEGDELFFTQAGVDEDGEDRAVPLADLGVGAGGEEAADMVHGNAGEGLFGGFGWSDLMDGIFEGGVIDLGFPPVEEGFDGTKGGMDAAGIAVGGEGDEVVTKDGGGELFNGEDITGGEVSGEPGELVFIVLEGARGEVACLAVYEEGGEFL